MKVAVRYYTKSGNTKKLADKIARTANIEAKSISEKLTEDIDILFLGSSVYAAGVDYEVKEFINAIDVKVGKVINFSTAAILRSSYTQVKKLIEKKGITMSEKEFHCKGAFGVMHKGKPNEKDLDDVVQFTKEVLKS